MIKRFFAMVLVFVTVCSLAACSGKQKPNKTPNTNKPRPAQTQTQPQTVPTEETVSDEDIFRQFLDGEIEAVLEPDEYDLGCICSDYDDALHKDVYLFPDQPTISLSGLRDTILATPRLIDPEAIFSYAVFQTLSGKKVLALRATNVGIDGGGYGDESYGVFLFAVNDGQLVMTYAYDSWSRNFVVLYDDLILTGWRNGGAQLSYTWCYFADETGHKQVVYESENRFGADGQESGATQEEIDAAFQAKGIDQNGLKPFDDWTYLN